MVDEAEHGSLIPNAREFLDRTSALRASTFRFRDRALERVFQATYYHDNLFVIRLAHWAGVGLWIAFWLVAGVALDETRPGELLTRIGLGVAVTLASLALTYAPWYPQRWQPVLASAHVLTGAAWSSLRVGVEDPQASWGYAGLMGLMAFTFFFSRLQTRYAVVAAAVMIVYYDVAVPLYTDDTWSDLLLANFFLLGFTGVATAAAYALERATRMLFLREREVDAERRRADDLLANTLPRVIVERLKARGAEPGSDYLAQDHPDVTVVFADLVSFTEHAGRIPADELVATLDHVFSRFDSLARELGVEKIKTVGDAYLAVAGVPEPRDDHATAAAELALAMVEGFDGARWPTGEPMMVRVGIATGPVVAGVIGTERFAYDLWGDTVNLASRLETSAAPGEILLAESTAVELDGHYRVSEIRSVDLKGKGRTPARCLLGRTN